MRQEKCNVFRSQSDFFTFLTSLFILGKLFLFSSPPEQLRPLPPTPTPQLYQAALLSEAEYMSRRFASYGQPLTLYSHTGIVYALLCLLAQHILMRFLHSNDTPLLARPTTSPSPCTLVPPPPYCLWDRRTSPLSLQCCLLLTGIGKTLDV